MSTTRFIFLDILKGIAILLIVYGHIIPGAVPLLTDYVSTFHIPLFFFVSGLLYNESKYKDSFKSLLTARAKGLLRPFFIFSAVVALGYAFVEKDYFFFLIGLTKNGWGGGNALWFIPVLFMVELVYWPLCRLPFKWKAMSLITFAVLSYFSSQKIGLVSNNALLTFCGLWFYGIGNICRSLLKYYSLTNYKALVLLVIGFGGSLLYIPICSILPEWFINKIPSPIYYLTPLFAIIEMIGISLLIEKKLSRYIAMFLSTCGKNSLIILAFHQIICMIAQQYVPSKVAIIIMVVLLAFLVRMIPQYLPWVLGKT